MSTRILYITCCKCCMFLVTPYKKALCTLAMVDKPMIEVDINNDIPDWCPLEKAPEREV